MTDRPTEPPRAGYHWVKTDLDYWVQEPERRRKSTPHGLLKQAVIAAIRKLETPDCRPIVVPQFSGRVTVESGAQYKAGQPGASDLLVVYYGRAIALELKAGRDQQRSSQAHWQRLFERAGGLYAIVRTPADAIEALNRARDSFLLKHASEGRLF